jgi:hypothetical protein
LGEEGAEELGRRLSDFVEARVAAIFGSDTREEEGTDCRTY